MAFDRTNPTDLATLKAEVFDNAAHYPDPSDTQDVLDKLNTASLARTTDTGVPALTLGILWNIIADEGATATQFEYATGLLYSMAAQEGPVTDISEFRAGVIALGDIQVNNAINALTRDLTMGEQLFAVLDANGSTEVVLISREDWFAARDS